MKTQKKIFLHIGKHKTGSSALQWLLLNNYELLSRKGFLYPKHKIDVNNVSSGNAAKLAQQLEKDYSDAKAYVCDILKNEHEKIILSSELLYKLDESKIVKIKDLFCTSEVTIILYLRRQDYLISSCYNQFVKRRGTTEKISDWWQCNIDLPIWTDDRLMQWSRIFGRDHIRVRLYENQQFVCGNLFSDFLDLLRLKLTSEWHIPAKQINPAYHVDVLETMRLFNHLELETKQRKCLDWLLQEFSENCTNKEGWPYDLLSPAERCQIIDLFTESNAKTAQYFLNRKDGKLFYESPPKLDEPWQPYKGLSKDKLLQIITFIADKNLTLSQYLYKAANLGLQSHSSVVQEAAEKLHTMFKKVYK